MGINPGTLGTCGQPVSARESKPSTLSGQISRLSSRVGQLEAFIADLKGIPQEVAKPTNQADPTNFEYVYNTAPKILEEHIARLENATITLRDMLL